MINFKCGMALSIGLLISSCIPASGQDARKQWEFGISGSVSNLTRTMVSDFHETPGGDYVFTIEEKSLYGGTGLYVAREIKDWLYLDVQGTFGLAEYYDSGKEKTGHSILLGPGLQIRPFVRSQWIQPYLRIGVDYFSKSFSTRYFGQFDNDPTKEGMWKAEDAWNKGLTVDRDHSVPVSLGCGVTGWVSSRTGIRLQCQYLAPLSGLGVNFLQSSAGLVFRFGGDDKRKAVSDQYVHSHPSDYDSFYSGRLPAQVIEKEVVKEIVKEVPVEKVLEVVRDNTSLVSVSDLMDIVNFEFDRSVITEDSEHVLDQIADILRGYPQSRFLVAGHTDSRGSDEYNDALSLARARAVVDALVRRGVPAESLCARGFGKKMAVVSENESDEARRGDRKVVIEKVSDDYLWNCLKQIENR